MSWCVLQTSTNVQMQTQAVDNYVWTMKENTNVNVKKDMFYPKKMEQLAMVINILENVFPRSIMSYKITLSSQFFIIYVIACLFSGEVKWAQK